MPNVALQKLDFEHCLAEMPYRAIVYVRSNGQIPTYKVAGVAGGPWSARNALLKAAGHFGGKCFYCGQAAPDLTIDHIEPATRGGSDALTNLALACKPCNAKKGDQVIDAFKPSAGRDWLLALHAQIEARLAAIAKAPSPLAPRPPSPRAADGP